MRLIVSSIPEDGLERELEIPVTVGDNISPDIARVSLRALKFGKKVLIDGLIKIDISFTCGRCLKGFMKALEIRFRDEYNPAEEIDGTADQELNSEELDLSYYRNDEIDIGEIVKEQVILAVPMKPLCDSGCKGICPECGRDLSEGACGCSRKEVDPRLEPLGRLKELMKERKE